MANPRRSGSRHDEDGAGRPERHRNVNVDLATTCRQGKRTGSSQGDESAARHGSLPEQSARAPSHGRPAVATGLQGTLALTATLLLAGCLTIDSRVHYTRAQDVVERTEIASQGQRAELAARLCDQYSGLLRERPGQAVRITGGCRYDFEARPATLASASWESWTDDRGAVWIQPRQHGALDIRGGATAFIERALADARTLCGANLFINDPRAEELFAACSDEVRQQIADAERRRPGYSHQLATAVLTAVQIRIQVTGWVARLCSGMRADGSWQGSAHDFLEQAGRRRICWQLKAKATEP